MRAGQTKSRFPSGKTERKAKQRQHPGSLLRPPCAKFGLVQAASILPAAALCTLPHPLSTWFPGLPVQTVGKWDQNFRVSPGLTRFHFSSARFWKTRALSTSSVHAVSDRLSTFPGRTVTATG